MLLTLQIQRFIQYCKATRTDALCVRFIYFTYSATFDSLVIDGTNTIHEQYLKTVI